jgi:hypothetical protein
MEKVSTAVLVGLTLLGVGIVIDRLFWLKRWLNKVPPVVDLPTPPEPLKSPEQRRESPVIDGNTDPKRHDSRE